MGHPAVLRSALQVPSLWKKPFSARAVSQGRDAWLRSVPAVPSAKETARGWAQGLPPSDFHGHDSPFLEVLGACQARDSNEGTPWER